MGSAAAFALCVRAVEQVLGGTIAVAEPDRGSIEAAFGLIGSERLSILVEPLDAQRSRISLQSRRGARPQAAPASHYVDALCNYLMTSQSM